MEGNGEYTTGNSNRMQVNMLEKGPKMTKKKIHMQVYTKMFLRLYGEKKPVKKMSGRSRCSESIRPQPVIQKKWAKTS